MEFLFGGLTDDDSHSSSCAYYYMESISQSTFAYFFLSLLIEGAPFILLGTMVSGFIDVYMPSGAFERFLPKRKVPAVLLCGLLGIIIPVCECAVVPVIRRLVAKGLPVSCAFTYMLAAPIVNPITILSTWSAFNEQQALYITMSRIGIGYLIAVVVGLVLMLVPVEKVIRKTLLATVKSSRSSKDSCANYHHEQSDQCCSSHHDGDASHSCSHSHSSNGSESSHRVVAAMRSGMKDFVDVAVYFTIGVCLTAMFNILQVDYHDSISIYASDSFKGTAMLMVLAFVLSVCSTSDAFLAASLGSFNYAAKMAFMVFGPMLDVKLIFLYQTVMRGKFLFLFSVFLFVAVLGTCIAWAEWEVLMLWCQDVSHQLSIQGKEVL
ncbi:permease [Rubritalea sp.]|uniref:permease n=1 Tax=Rubritalea sp. TaxID=2109375 RepID=UPI003242D866